MIKKLFIFFFALLFSFGILSSVVAQEPPMPQEVNSFELFWPVSAGKTMGESLYGLKTFKEKVRGAFIFGKLQKVDYSLFLATKRIVEVEKLLNDGKIDLAKKTLVKMDDALNTALSNISIPQELKGKGEVDEINKKLGNLEIFLEWLASKNDQVKNELELLLTRVQDINRKI